MSNGEEMAYKLLIFFIAAMLFFTAAAFGAVVFGFGQKLIIHYEAYLAHLFFTGTKISFTFALVYLGIDSFLKFERKRFENQVYQQKLFQIKLNNGFTEAMIAQMKTGRVFLSEQKTLDGVVKFQALSKKAVKENAELPLLSNHEAEQPKDGLLADLVDCQRLLIVGGQNAGKTTLLKHIAKQRSGRGEIVILDSHNHVGKWHDSYRVIGHGRDYKAIEKEFKNLVAVMDGRYKEYASGKVGERQHSLITVMSDEYTTIAENTTGLDAFLLPLLTESRKVGIDFIVACHSETAGSLGLKGRFDLKKNFDAILRLKKINNNRLVTVDNGETAIVYQHPGFFTDDSRYEMTELKNSKLSQMDLDIDSLLNTDLERETQVVDAYYALKNSGRFSWNNLSKTLYDGKVNGRYVKEIKAVLERHGIEINQ
jgi:hypothetical protein